MLSFYIGRHFLLSFAVIFALFMFLILIFDAVELLRRSAARPDVTFALVMEMAFLKLPYMGQQVLPFAIFFGGMNAFWRLTRSHELVITRSAGVSALARTWSLRSRSAQPMSVLNSLPSSDSIVGTDPLKT